MIDWDIIKVTVVAQTVLAGLWKFGVILHGHIVDAMEIRLKQVRIWALENFVTKADFNHLHDELHKK